MLVHFDQHRQYIICTDGEDVDRISLMKVLAIMQQADSREGILYVTAAGDVQTLRKYLEMHPEEVCNEFL